MGVRLLRVRHRIPCHARHSMPPGPLGDVETSRQAFEQAVYSPGSVCPLGWETACSFLRNEPPPSTETDARENILWEMLEEGQTVVGCCPE